MTVTWNGQNLEQGLRLAVMRGVATVANVVRNEAIDSIISGPKTGAVYTRRGVTHQASAPGEPPANDLGNLQNSITVRLFPNILAATVNSAAAYSAALEFGTVRMEPRPYMRRALMKHIPTLNRVIAAEVKHYLARQGK